MQPFLCRAAHDVQAKNLLPQMEQEILLLREYVIPHKRNSACNEKLIPSSHFQSMFACKAGNEQVLADFILFGCDTVFRWGKRVQPRMDTLRKSHPGINF